MFYPEPADELRAAVDGFLAEAAARRVTGLRPPPCRAIVAPHAGYLYSGAIAGVAFDALSGGEVDRVVILGPSHFVPMRGLALPAADALVTPLGAVAIDDTAVARIVPLPQVALNDAAHAREHSIEVELPFVQVRFPRARIVPLTVGVASAAEVAEVIALLMDSPATRLVISSDLSHYLPYESAVATDAETASTILRLDPSLSAVQACGVYPLNGLLLAASRLGWTPRTLDLRNSGDTAGDRRRVVGYGALAFEERAG
jgi:AmmeMemoRadiSam system protein B